MVLAGLLLSSLVLLLVAVAADLNATALVAALSALVHSQEGAWQALVQAVVQPLGQGLGALGGWAPAVFVLLMAAAVALLVPASFFALAGGAVFGVYALLWVALGALFGAMLAFFLGRYCLADWAHRRFAAAFVWLDQEVGLEGWRVVALLRVTPVVPFVAANYLLSLTPLSWREYGWATAVFALPSLLSIAFLGHLGRQALGERLNGTDAWVGSPWLPWGLMLAVAVLLLPGMWQRARARRQRFAEKDSR